MNYKLCCLSDETDWFLGHKLLLNQNFPLIFDSISGKSQGEVAGSSYFNTKEIDAVIKWVKKLLQVKRWKGRETCVADIGVVSPYKEQCLQIREELENNGLGGISVGTAEVFQGQERRIMIISTVRTGNELGFVSNEQVKC